MSEFMRQHKYWHMELDAICYFNETGAKVNVPAIERTNHIIYELLKARENRITIKRLREINRIYGHASIDAILVNLDPYVYEDDKCICMTPESIERNKRGELWVNGLDRANSQI